MVVEVWSLFEVSFASPSEISFHRAKCCRYSDAVKWFAHFSFSALILHCIKLITELKKWFLFDFQILNTCLVRIDISPSGMLMSTYFKVFPGVIVDVDVVVVVFNWHTSIIIQLTIAKGMIRQIFDAISLLLTDSLKHIHHQLNNAFISNIFCRFFSNMLLVTLGQFHQRVYGQLLRLLILKVQKSCLSWLSFFCFWDLHA